MLLIPKPTAMRRHRPSRRSPSLLLPFLFLFSLLSPVAASGIGGTQQLFTSSAVYCSPPEAILISALDLHFYRSNRTLEFDISAASVQDDLRVSVSVNVNAYGLGLFSLEIDLCSSVPALCPLPNYQFTGAGVFAVPEQFVEKIPSIAFMVPNLEAVATVELTDSGGNVVGCVQATLSNGKTMFQPAAKWAVLGVLILALISSVLHTSIASSLGAAQWRVVDVFTTIQHMPMSALLSLNYPQVFLEFARNFAWSIGLINIGAVQRSIVSTREKTGGKADGVFGKLLKAESGKQFNPFTSAGVRGGQLGAFTSAKPFSLVRLPENTAYAAGKLEAVQFAVTDLGKRQIYAPYTGAGGQIAQNVGSNYLPVISSNTPPPIGLGYFAELNDVSPASAFLTVLVSLAMVFAVLLGICVFVFVLAAAVRLATRKSSGRGAIWARRLTGGAYFTMFCRPLWSRFTMATFQLFCVFAFWQWLRGDSWVPDLLAAVLLVVYLAGIALIYVPIFVAARRLGRESLFYGSVPPANAPPTAQRWGAIVHPFNAKYFWFGLVFLLVYFVRACFIGFAQGYDNNLRQSIGLAVTDVLFFLVLCICRPGRDKTSDFVMIVLLVFRVASWGICIALTPLADVETIPRVVLGFALVVVTGLPIVFLFVLTCWDLVSPFVRRRQWSATRVGDEELVKEERGYEFGAVGAAGAGGATEDRLATSHEGSGESQGEASSGSSEDGERLRVGGGVLERKSSMSRQDASVATGQPVEHVAAPSAAPQQQNNLTRPVPSHANSAVSASSGQTVYYDART